MIKIQIDGTGYEVKPGKNLLETCLSLGFDIPYFCFHPALGSVGACRLCAVKKFRSETDNKGQIVMSCMEPVTDGLIISVSDPEVLAFRKSVIEGLMLNHPHDCPICDEGGECHLQDMTVMTGHNYRRYDYKKRTYINQYLGPFIKHEMNRCIQCYRCVRFYRDYAGGKDLNVYGSANHVYFGRHQDGVLESEFSGNLVEICPTGVFTDKILHKNFTRKWDLTNAPSVCVNCSLGCNTLVSERYGSVKRIMNRYNGDLNGYLLCDRGRFGYEFINHEKRLKIAQVRYSKNSEMIDKGEDAIMSVVTCAAKENKVAAIGSPRASLESNFALMSLFGAENFYHGVSSKEQEMIKTIINLYQNYPVHSPSLKEIEKSDAILVLGEDITNTAPMMALALRQASRTKNIEIAESAGIPQWHDKAVRQLAQEIKTPFFVASTYSTKLDELAEETFRASNEEIARLGFAIASYIDSSAPEVKNLDKETSQIAKHIAQVLMNAKNPLIVSGTHSNSEAIIQAAGNVAMALSSNNKKVNLSFCMPECNSMGLGLMPGKNLNEIIERLRSEDIKTLIILENDLFRRTDQNLIELLTEKCPQLIVLDHTVSETTKYADILFPVTTFAESHGTFVNNEGRAQKFYSVIPENGNIKDSWKWIREMMQLSMQEESIVWKHSDDLLTSMLEELPVFSKIKELPTADFRIFNEKISRQTHRFSGRTSMNAKENVSEQKPPQDTEAPFAFSMEGFKGITPANLTPFYWSPGWNSVQAANKYLKEPNGDNIGGNAGIRLFEENKSAKVVFYENIPEAIKLQKDEWQIVPVHQIFGSEELSPAGKAISELIREPFLLLNGKTIENLNLNTSEKYMFTLNDHEIQVNIIEDKEIPEGIAGISVKLPGMPYLELPATARAEIRLIERNKDK